MRAFARPYDTAPWKTASAIQTILLNGKDFVFSSKFHCTISSTAGGGQHGGYDLANDPVFWLHHCNIDRLWRMAGSASNDDPYLPEDGAPTGQNLNEPMIFNLPASARRGAIDSRSRRARSPYYGSEI